MQAASILLALITVLISGLLLLFMIKGNAWSRIHSGIRSNAPWLVLLLVAMALDLAINLLVPNPPYLVRMSAQTEIFAGISIWLQNAIPVSIGPSFFAIVYYTGFAIFMITLPIYFLSMGENKILKRYCLSLALASFLLVFFKLIVLSVRPSLDPASGSVGPLLGDPFWGPISLDLSPKGNSFPSGHALTLMAAVIAIWPMKRLRVVVLGLLCLIILTVLYLDIHWPLDVIAGIAIGVVCGVAAIVFVDRWQKKGSNQSGNRSDAK